jgi:hypothetical protein
MGGAFLIVWGVALAAIVALGTLLVWTLRRQPAVEEGESPRVTGGVQGGAGSGDTLLFYYEEESVRTTPDGRVIIRMSGLAWEREWHDDLLRLEVGVEDPASVEVPAEWGAAEVLAAYSLRAYRMTDLGTDIEVERFAAPVDVFLTVEGVEPGLRFGVNHEGRWTLAPPATLSPETIEGIDIPAGESWAAASIAGMREICLVRVSEQRPVAGEQAGPAGDG